MSERIADVLFDSNVICPQPAPPYFPAGFGKKIIHTGEPLAFNQWFGDHRDEILKLVQNWGVVAIENASIASAPLGWQRLDFSDHAYLPWHSDGCTGMQVILLAQSAHDSPRTPGTVVAPNTTIYEALQVVLLENTNKLSAALREKVRRIFQTNIPGSTAGCEDLYHFFQLSSLSDRPAIRALFDQANKQAGKLVYHHTWKQNSVLLMDTKHHNTGTDTYSQVVHGRVITKGTIVSGTQPWRKMIA